MDPNIMRLLEEDEDETMHSGADVEAFQAALNRDIGGDVYSSQPSDSVAGKNDNANNTEELNAQNVEKQHHHQEQHSSVMETKQNGPNAENQQQLGVSPQEPTHPPLIKKTSQDDIKQEPVEQVLLQTPQSIGMQSFEQNPIPKSEPDKIQSSDGDPNFLNFQKMSNQQTAGTDQKNEIAKDQFVRLMRNIVGDQVLRLAAARLQSQPGTNQSQSQPQAGRQHNVPMPAVQLQTDSSIANSQKSKAVEWKPDSPVMQASQSHSSNASIANQERERSLISPQGQNKQKQHVHFPPASFPMYGSSGSNYHPYSGTNVSTSGPSVKPQPLDPQTRQISHHQNMGVTQTGGPMHNMISTPKV
ncbi:hypothetical protein OIU74_007002 [Salix koriyanagi]|uniref:RST domain-containing protein n=1 Tax=Salix koriyanagi TaxID=2511006 RepID=A0A9Q0Z5R8_9ROSI|nr:hypothetical protein OIU74_007002 [Salix koriyanagi]